MHPFNAAFGREAEAGGSLSKRLVYFSEFQASWDIGENMPTAWFLDMSQY